MKMFRNSLEKASDIKTDSSFSKGVASYNVSTLTDFSEVVKVVYNCGDNKNDETADGSSFKCEYKSEGEYNVLYLVYTSVGNEYLFSDHVSVTEVSFAPSCIIPSILFMVLAILFLTR